MTQLVLYDKARTALKKARSVDEVKDVKDKAEALRLYAKQARDIELEHACAEIKLRAQRRLGEISRGLDTQPGQRTDKPLPTTGKRSKHDTLKAAGLSTSSAHRYEGIEAIPEEDFERYIAEKRAKGRPVSAEEVVKKTGRSLRRDATLERIRSRTVQSLDGMGPYNVIYADPPWADEMGTMPDSRDIERHYPTSPTSEIAAMPVGSIAAKDCVLFLWTLGAKLEEALEVIRGWGFRYRTDAVWVKPSIGMGYWFRQQHETLLVAGRGDIPTPPEGDRPSSVITAPRGRHSQKPDAVIEMIDRAYPNLAKVELFARSERPGWESWGYEA